MSAVEWHRGRMLAFDVETDGPDPREARIVSYALVLVGGEQATWTGSEVVNPGVEIPQGAIDVHGITNEMAAAGRPAAEAIPYIVDFLADRSFPVVAFNGRFDFTVIDREARRHGVVPLTERRQVCVIDPLLIDKNLDRYRRGSRKLDAVAAHYRATLVDGTAHEAASDALTAARIAWVQIERGMIVRRENGAAERAEADGLRAEWQLARASPEALHMVQEKWAHEQAASLEEYFARTGTPQKVAREWPVIPIDAVGS